MPAFMLAVVARSSNASAFAAHAGTACRAKVAFYAAHASAHLLRFGVSAFRRHATGRDAQAQSGCLPVGSLLTNRQLQSATAQRHEVACPAAVNGQHALRHLSSRHRQTGRPSVGGQQTKVAVCRPSASGKISANHIKGHSHATAKHRSSRAGRLVLTAFRFAPLPNMLVKPTPTACSCWCPPRFALRRGLPRALRL